MKIKYKSKVRQQQRERARALKAATTVPKPKTTSTERMRKLRARRKAMLLDDEPICTGVDTSNVEPEIKLERDDDEGNPDKDVPSLEINIKMEHDEDEIKEEFTIEENSFQCRICLSVGRKMSLLDEYEEIYKKLLFDSYPDQNEHIQFSTVLVCWECHAALRNVDRFQRRVRTGHDMLQTNNVSLSTLTTVFFSDSNPGTIYLKEADNKTDNLNSETETNDNQEDNDLNIEKEHQEDREGNNKGSTKKKVTGKRKMVERKPKFKVVEGVEIFKRVVDESRNDENCKRSECKCSNCVLSVDDANELDDHNRECVAEEIRPYVCDVRQRRLREMAQPVSHSQHSTEFICRLCSYRCSEEKDRELHAKTHRRVTECLECGRLFENRRQFNDHYKEYHEKFTCDHCGLSFKMKSALVKHISRKHTKLECKICNKKFSMYRSLWLHNTVFHGPRSVTSS